MKRVVFLLEDRSMAAFLEAAMPRLFPDVPFLCVPHEGKRDLELSIPRKLRAWKEPGACFVVLRDNDGGDCRALKSQLTSLCHGAGKPETLVRLACQELEAWYLGDLRALDDAFGVNNAQKVSTKAKYRDPDSIPKPSDEVRRLVPEFQKISGARKMGRYLSGDRNLSHSFRNFLHGIEALITS